MNERRLKNLLLSGLVFVLLSASACSKSGGGSAPTTAPTAGAPARVVVGLGHSLVSSPEMVWASQKGILKKDFPTTKFVFVRATGSAENPMTDLAEFTRQMASSECDFVYADLSSLLQVMNYGGGRSGPPPYVVIAGATYRNRVLMGVPSLTSVKELGGKTVGIYNRAQDTEMLLNKVLQKQGLRTEALGGTVKVRYDTHNVLMRDFESGKIDAFYIHSNDYPELTGKGARILDSGTDAFGGKTPWTVLAVRTDFMQRYPDFVNRLLGVHVDSAETAMRDVKKFVDVAYAFNQHAYSRESLLKRVHGSGCATVVATYDPDLAYVQEAYTFLTDAKYLRLLRPSGDLVDVSALDDVLKGKGLKPVPQAK